MRSRTLPDVLLSYWCQLSPLCLPPGLIPQKSELWFTHRGILVGHFTWYLYVCVWDGVCLSVPDISNLWPVLEEPAIGNLVLPANIPGVLPQEADLPLGVSSVPEGIPQMLTWACLRFHHLAMKRVIR